MQCRPCTAASSGRAARRWILLHEPRGAEYGLLVLRVCMNAPVSEGTMHVGCELMGEAPELLSMAADLGVKIVGISFSIGAGACSLGIYAYAIAQACRLFGVAASLGHDLCVLDIGGGFPCGSLTRGPSFSQVTRLQAVEVHLKEFFMLELFLGDYDMSVCFSLVFDSGTAGFVYQTNEGFFGSFGCRLTAFCEPKCRPLVECVHDVSADHYTYATILGPTLSSNVDIVQPVARLPQMQIGEWLLWDDMGAYSMGNLETLGEDGQPSPTIYYFVDDERWQHMSRPSTPERVADVDGSSHKREGTEVEVDSHSMESMESESAVTDDEPYWPNLEQWLTD
uniref:Orn/DAP/Arg decarboxylase 2 N-terminal domain-containing protein n=1 Tax=Parascaris equorum TaxID=6256 RepID=A0A914S4T9_PAREQ